MWTSGIRLPQIDLSTLLTGNYNFTIIGWDGINGGNFTNEVDVFVSSNPPPAISAATTMTVVQQNPLVVVYINATTGHNITFTLSDQNLETLDGSNNANYSIYLDDILNTT